MVGVLAPQESDLASEISISNTKMSLRYVVNRVISFESVIRRLSNHRRTHEQLCHTSFSRASYQSSHPSQDDSLGLTSPSGLPILQEPIQVFTFITYTRHAYRYAAL
jgi:hypothetical protein